MRTLLLISCAALASAASAQQSAPAPASLVREGVTAQLTKHVWVIPDRSANLVPNVGIIVGRKAVLVVDTRSKAQVEDIAAGAGMNLVPVFAARSELNKQLLEGAHRRAADITFDDTSVVDLGGVKARLFAMGTNHTHGDTAVLVDGVLFSGDIAMKPQPAFANPTATITHWLSSLDRLDAMRAKTLVPSHGPMGGPEIIQGNRTYLARVRDRAAVLKQSGKTQDETAQMVTDEMSAEYPD